MAFVAETQNGSDRLGALSVPLGLVDISAFLRRQRHKALRRNTIVATECAYEVCLPMCRRSGRHSAAIVSEISTPELFPSFLFALLVLLARFSPDSDLLLDHHER